ncbi:MAG: cellulase family glycosylhydrolase [Lachnospiraceae bacterium]|nr:cellulase family glycosylhydrolase [Lachnospiraceae bacterium]
MKRKIFKSMCSFVLLFALIITSCGLSGVASAEENEQAPVSNANTNLTEEHLSANGITTRDNGIMRKDLSNLDLMDEMGLGWNMGNQMEQSNWQGNMESVEACETSAGNAAATQLTFDGLKSYGVNTVRVPVAWSNFMSDDGNYTISETLFDRVEEIINYALNDEMYVIINVHWDGGWWGRFGAEEFDAEETPIRDEAWKKYRAIWTQISERYKEYSDHLIFEGANEELSGRLNDNYEDPNTAQQNQTGKLGKATDEKTADGKTRINADEIYEMVNQINQEFVNIVRESGGNNAYRHLLIPGTGNESCVIDGNENEVYIQDGTIDERFHMPDDPAEEETGVKKMSISVHYYDPTDYGLSATATTSWGYRDKWGVDYVDANGVEYKGQDDYDFMSNQLEKMKKFTDQGYGVILGECGVVKGYKDNIIDFMTELFTQSKKRHMVPVWWDEGHYYNRGDGYFSYDDVGHVYAEMTNSTPVIPDDADLMYTGIKEVPSESNKTPKVIATWEGEFMRHTDGDTAAIMEVEREGDWDPSNNGIGKTTLLKDSAGNVTTGVDAMAMYDSVFSSWKTSGTNLPFGWTNSSTGANGEPVDKMIAEIDKEYWNIHFKVDWSKIEKPCVRVYPANNETSMNADLQLGYIDEWTAADLDVTALGKDAVDNDKKIDVDSLTKEEYDALVQEKGEKKLQSNLKKGAAVGKCKGKFYNDVDYSPGVGLQWVGKYVTLDKESLKKYPYLWVTTNTYTGASYVKIEICDAAYNAGDPDKKEPQATTKPQTTTKPTVTKKPTVTTLKKPVISKLTSKKRTLTVKFAKVKSAKKYKIQVSTDKKFKKSVKTKTVSSVKKVTFKKLKSGKKYYVRVRAVSGKTQSKWSKTKSKKVK